MPTSISVLQALSEGIIRWNQLFAFNLVLVTAMHQKDRLTETAEMLGTLLVTRRTARICWICSCLVLKGRFPACLGRLSIYYFISLHQKINIGYLNFPYSNLYMIKTSIHLSSVASWQWKSRCFVDILRLGRSLNFKFSLIAITCWLPSCSAGSLSAREDDSAGWALERYSTCSGCLGYSGI